MVAGNHDLTLDTKKFDKIQKNFNYRNEIDILPIKQSIIDNCIYLEDSMVELYGYYFYGSPYSVEFGGWVFMEQYDDL